jgi:hypothetical protein
MKKVVFTVLALVLAWAASAQATIIPLDRQIVRPCVVLKGMERFPGYVFVAEGQTRHLIRPGACFPSGPWAIAAVPRSILAQKGLWKLDLTDPHNKWWVARNLPVRDYVRVSGCRPCHVCRSILALYQPFEVVRLPDGRFTLRQLARVIKYGRESPIKSHHGPKCGKNVY